MTIKYEAFLKIIEENYSDNELTLKKIAEKVCMSNRALQYKVKHLLGKSPMRYLRHYRLERAKELIISERINIGCIAERVGFSNQPYFSKCFKEYTGVPPTRYRNDAITT